jgi:hypothetical protein
MNRTGHTPVAGPREDNTMRVNLTLCAVFGSLLFASAPALSCSQTLHVAVPEWMMRTTDYGSIQDTIRQATDASGEICLTFRANVSDSGEALAMVEGGASEAALVPTSAVARKHREFLPVISGYRFQDAHALQDAFSAARKDMDGDGSIAVLGLATGKPAFPVFQSDAHKDGPDFASKFAVVPDPDPNKIGKIRADALLSTPARFGSYVFLANSDALDSLAPEDRSNLDRLIDTIGRETADRSDAGVNQFLDEARKLGMQSFDLKETDRQKLLSDIEKRFSEPPSFNSAWIQQCTEGSCPCAGSNFCAENCCESQ